MTHIKSLLLILALCLFFQASYSQDTLRQFVQSNSQNMPFIANKAFGVNAGLGYVQDGDFNFCLGGRFQHPIGQATQRNKQFIADLSVDLDLRSFSNELFSNSSTGITFTPGFIRACSFGEKVDMFAGLRAPIRLGRTKSTYDGQEQSSDNISSVGIQADYGVSYRLTEDSFVSASTSFLGWNRFTRTDRDNPATSVSDSGAWFGFGKNNTLKLSYNKILGGDMTRR